MKLTMRAAAGRKITLITAAFVLAVSTVTGAVPLLLSRDVNAVSEAAYSQGFEAGTDGVLDKDTPGFASYGDVNRVSSGAYGIPAAEGSYYATVSQTSSGPFTRFDGYRTVWAGEWQSSVAVYLDPSWVNGSGFDWTVAANTSSNTHKRDFVFHVEKDASTGSLLVAGSNNTSFAPKGNLEAGNHYTVTNPGWYTLEHSFRDVAGVLVVDLKLVDAAGVTVFTETRSDASDLIASLGANRYGWFTYVSVPGGLAIDNLALRVSQAPVRNITTGEEFLTIKQAITDADTLNGHTIEVAKDLTVTEATVVNKAVSIRGINNATITTSGTTQLFTVTANGVSIKDLNFVKSDNANQNIIGVQADNVTIAGNNFTAQYSLAANAGTTRALVVSPGVDSLSISGNTFNNIRQPAYINNDSTGALLNNYVNETRGWVIEKASNFELTGNTWGQNAVDIAIIPGSNSESTPNNYTCRIPAIKDANNTPTIEDQRPAAISSCPNNAPVVNFIGDTPANGAWVRGAVNGSINATDDWGMGSYYIRYWKDAFEAGGSLVANCQSAPGAFLLGTSVNASCDYNTTALADGSTIVLSAQFLDGHNKWGSALRTYRVDNTAPTITIKKGTSLTDGSSSTQPYTHISFKLYDKAGNLERVTLNGNIYNRAGTWNDLNWVNINKGHLLQGDNLITVRDKAGNESSVTFKYDSIAPVVTLNQLDTTVRGTVAVSALVEDNVALSHYNLSLYDGAIDLSDGEAHSSDRIAVSGGWTTTGQTNISGTSVQASRSLDTTQLADGTYQIRLGARDKAGNRGGDSVKYFSFTVDNTAPVVTVESAQFTPAQAQVIRGTVDDPSARVTLYIDDVEVSSDIVSDTSGDWSYTLTAPLPADVYGLRVVAVDALGNQSMNPSTPDASYGTLLISAPAQQGAAPNNGAQDQEEGTAGTPVQTFNTGTPLPLAFNPAAAILGTTTQGSGQDETETDESDPAPSEEVEGTATQNTLAQAVDADNTDGNAMGLAWYWWLLIIAGGATALWWLIAAIRGRSTE